MWEGDWLTFGEIILSLGNKHNLSDGGKYPINYIKGVQAHIVLYKT